MNDIESVFRRAVEYAISVVGIEGLRATSMFPNSTREGWGGGRSGDGGTTFVEGWGGD